VFKVPTAVQIRVTLQEIEPPIWRRLIVPRTFHLGELHQVIQAAFGWWDYHLHEFQIGGLSFSDPDLVQPEFEGDPHVYDEREVQLLDFSRGEDINFVYVYDFGDDWHHLVEFELASRHGTCPARGTMCGRRSCTTTRGCRRPPRLCWLPRKCGRSSH